MFKVRDFIANEKWNFAKTYANSAPHEYIVRHKHAGTDEDFLNFVKAIELYGQTLWFFKRPNKYLYVDGRYYWTMSTAKVDDSGEVVFDYTDEHMVINRSNAKDYFISIRWKGLPK